MKLLLVSLICLATTLLSYSKEIKIVGVHSYNSIHLSTSTQLNTIKDKLSKIYKDSRKLNSKYKEPITFNIINLYMESKDKNRSIAKMKSIATKHIEEINKYQPDLIIVTDDNAFRYVGIPVSDSIPTFYSGINISLEEYSKEFNLSDKLLSGTEESFDFTKILNLLSDGSIYLNDVYVLIDNRNNISTTGRHLLNNFKKNLKKSSYDINTTYIEITTDTELIQKLTSINTKSPGILLILLQRIFTTSDQEIATNSHINELIINYNKKHLEVAPVAVFVKEGIASSIGTDFTEMGINLGKLIDHYLLTGELQPTIDTKINLSVGLNRVRELNFMDLVVDNYNEIDKVYK